MTTITPIPTWIANIAFEIALVMESGHYVTINEIMESHDIPSRAEAHQLRSLAIENVRAWREEGE